MNRIKITKALALTLIYVFPVFLYGQEDDAAAASSTGSAAAPAKGAPKAAQANSQLRTLHIAIHKLGLSAAEILAAGSLDDLHAQYKEALKGGGFQAFTDHGKNMVKHGATLDEAIEHGDLLDRYSLQEAKDHGDLLRQNISLEDAILHGDSIRAGHSLDDAKNYKDLTDLGFSLADAKIHFALIRSSGVTSEQWNALSEFLQGGFSLADSILLNDASILATYSIQIRMKFETISVEEIISLFETFGYEDILNYGDLLAGGFSLSDILQYEVEIREALASGTGLTVSKILENAKGLFLDSPDSLPSDMLSLAKQTVESLYSDSYVYNESLTSALSVASSLLQDKIISSTLPATSVTVSQLNDGYNLELIRLLSAYGAIGGNGENVASAVLGSDYSGYAKGGTLSSLIQNSSADYLSFLTTLTGSRGFSEEDSSESVLDVSLDKITLIPGSTITLGSSGADSTIDVSSKLTPATSSDDRKVLILGAAKDLTVAGNVKFTNPNDVEDHALVIGAADDVMVDGANIEYTGSNLAIGAGGSDADSMYLVNTSITTGGNLAAGSLGNLNITNANFNVGMANSASSDPDNVYLYANEILNVTNAAFSGRVDDIYMESKTIHISDTTFPSTSEVMLRSQSGILNINNSVKPTMVGAVNFHNVKHLGISDSVLTNDQFQGSPGHVNSLGTLPNGTPLIRVRAQY